MERRVDLAESLATNIWWLRRKQVEEKFFREVSESTYNKWFVNPQEDGEPYLDEAKHGGFFRTEEDEIHYYMLKRKYYSSYKKDHHFYPRKKSMEKSVKMARNMMRYNVKSNILRMRTVHGMDLHLIYDRMPADFSDTKYAYKFAEGIVDESFTEKSGRMSSLDRLIVESVRQWSLDNDLKCIIEYRE